MQRRTLAVLILLATAATTVACGDSAGTTTAPPSSATSAPSTSAPSTTAAPSAAVAPTPLPGTTRAALGDLRTLDPCSLVDLATFRAFGVATFGDPQSLDYCVVEVQGSSVQTEVHIGEVVAASYRPSPTVPGQPTCQAELRFADRRGLLATATPSDGPATAATCQLATAATAGAATAIQAGKAKHRTYPARSFGPVDACAVLRPETVAAVLKPLSGLRAQAHPAGHQCEYGASGDHTTYAALILAAAYARFDGGPDSTTFTVAGHQVVLVPDQPDGRSGECVGYGPHIGFPSRSGQPAMEMAELHVALPTSESEEKACADVKALARTVFAHLP